MTQRENQQITRESNRAMQIFLYLSLSRALSPQPPRQNWKHTQRQWAPLNLRKGGREGGGGGSGKSVRDAARVDPEQEDLALCDSSSLIRADREQFAKVGGGDDDDDDDDD